MNKIIFKFLFLIFIFFAFTLQSKANLLTDEFIDENLKDVKLEKPLINVDYNYEDIEKVPIKINIKKKISTKKDGIEDGQQVFFTVKEDVKYKGKIIIKKGTEISANVATTINRGMNGIPSTIIIDNFKIPNIDSKKLKAVIIKRGVNLSLLVFPIKWLLTPLPPLGSLTNFIVGGNATIKPKKTFVIYYYPNW